MDSWLRVIKEDNQNNSSVVEMESHVQFQQHSVRSLRSFIDVGPIVLTLNTLIRRDNVESSVYSS